MPAIDYALSIKQPWATLLVHGLKTIEIRSWPTSRRGRILIHAARLADPWEGAWAMLPPELREAAKLAGGLIGACELTGCIAYRSREAFAADQAKHLNEPGWFHPPVVYGFAVAKPTPLPFRPYPGWVRFFPIKDQLPKRSKKPGRASGKAASGPFLFSDSEG